MASQRDEWTVEEIQARAAEAGLSLTEEDARRLQVPVQRIRAMAREQSGNLKAAYADLLKASQLAPTWGLPRQDLKRYQVVSR